MPNYRPRLTVVTVTVVLAIAVSACGQDTAETTTPDTNTEADYPFGSPADAADANRVIEIITTDSLTFEPAEVTVISGETVTFRLINQGSLLHDFTLGDDATQDEHEAEMADMGGMAHDEPNVMTIPAGETAELTWTFTGADTVLIGCHQPGHYAAGMKGQITVES